MQVLQAGIINDNIRQISVKGKKKYALVMIAYQKNPENLDITIKSSDFEISSTSTKTKKIGRFRTDYIKCYHAQGKKIKTKVEIEFRNSTSHETIVKTVGRVWEPIIFLLMFIITMVIIFIRGKDSGGNAKNKSNNRFRSTGNRDLDTILGSRKGPTTVIR